MSRDVNIREKMNIVIIGHVDHGKSTLIGRLLADTNSLPDGKLESVKEMCRKNSRPFEYAFLLDALKDEQSQGITIDTARCFFKTEKRDYIIIDAPGHIEFLKNMISGAARAEAAFLVIDAKEGIQENSRRHGYLLALLGLKQVSVIVNKIDLASYSHEVFKKIRDDYSAFLAQIGVSAVSFIPVSAREGDNIISNSKKTAWFDGLTVIGQLDSFKKEEENARKPFRFPVQDIYKFTENGDDRRIITGAVESGSVSTGEEVIFFPSGKKAKIKSIEIFNSSTKTEAKTAEVPGFTLDTELYIKRGEVMCRASEKWMNTGTRFKANIFWMGSAPMIRGKKYKLKLASQRGLAMLAEIINVIDASELSTIANKKQIDRHDTAEIIIETTKPVAFDLYSDFESTGRFVIIDDYKIAGCGTIVSAEEDAASELDKHVSSREFSWARGHITTEEKEKRYGHRAKFILITGSNETAAGEIASNLEKKLFEKNYYVHYMGISNILNGLDRDIGDSWDQREEHIRRLGELAKIFTDAGQIFITALSDLDDYDLEILKRLNHPHEISVINIGENRFSSYKIDLGIESASETSSAVEAICGYLAQKDIIIEYNI